MQRKVTFLAVFTLLITTSIFGQTYDFDQFLSEIENQSVIRPQAARTFFKIPIIEEQEDISSLELDDYMRTEKFYGVSFFLTSDEGCELGYFVTIDQNGMMIDQVQITNVCEIDLSKQRFMRSEGELNNGMVEILQEEEYVIDPADTSETLDNSETELLIYNRYFEIESDGYMVELTSAKNVHLERDYGFASQELLTTEQLEEYSKNELRLIRSEIMASYGHIFDIESLQEMYEETSWYTAVGDASDKLSDVEKRNIALIDSILLQ